MCHFLFQHGEPGAAVADIQPVDIIVSHVLNQILSTVSLTGWLLLCILSLCSHCFKSNVLFIKQIGRKDYRS